MSITVADSLELHKFWGFSFIVFATNIADLKSLGDEFADQFAEDVAAFEHWDPAVDETLVQFDSFTDVRLVGSSLAAEMFPWLEKIKPRHLALRHCLLCKAATLQMGAGNPGPLSDLVSTALKFVPFEAKPPVAREFAQWEVDCMTDGEKGVNAEEVNEYLLIDGQPPAEWVEMVKEVVGSRFSPLERRMFVKLTSLRDQIGGMKLLVLVRVDVEGTPDDYDVLIHTCGSPQIAIPLYSNVDTMEARLRRAFMSESADLDVQPELEQLFGEL
jgi:hypothetical protein